MKKEEIYVEITNEQERLRAIEILQNSGEIIHDGYLFKENHKSKLYLHRDGDWCVLQDLDTKELTKITLDELESLLNPKKSNVFIDVQEWIRENDNGFTFTIKQDETPDCFKRLEQHLKNDYPQGTEIKISADKIEINHS